MHYEKGIRQDIYNISAARGIYFFQHIGRMKGEKHDAWAYLVYFTSFTLKIADDEWVLGLLWFWKSCCSSQGFVAAHTLPVLYERYEDQVDDFVFKAFDQLRNNYQKLDAGVLSKIPKGKFNGKKHE